MLKWGREGVAPTTTTPQPIPNIAVLSQLPALPDDDINDNAELGHSSEWKIETVIDWRRVVEIFYQLNGRPTIGLEELAVSDAIAAENVTIEMDGAKKPPAGSSDAKKPG